MPQTKEWVLSRIQQHWQDITRPDFPYPLPIQKTLEATIQQIETKWPDGYTEEEQEQMVNLCLYEPDMSKYLAIRPKLREMQLDYFDNRFGPMTDEEVLQKAATWMFPREMNDELADIKQIYKENPEWLPLYYELMEKLRQSPELPWQPGPLTPVSSEEHYEGYPVRIYHLASETTICRAIRCHAQYPVQSGDLVHESMRAFTTQNMLATITGHTQFRPPHLLRVLTKYVREYGSPAAKQK